MIQESSSPGPETIKITCSDGYVLTGHHFRSADARARGVVVIACATGVLATYYHRYAMFLAQQGFSAITFDYRGIGASAPASLKGFHARWYDWGYLDLDAVLRWVRSQYPNTEMHLVGHSFGGFGVGLAKSAHELTRILTVGAQHAYLPDYAPKQRRAFILRWHLLMPLLALRDGYLTGRERGWLEDLPRGVAFDWARSRKDFTQVWPRQIRERLRAHQQGVTAKILAVAATDDPFATESAIRRALSYTASATAETVRLVPSAFGCSEIGHFALFHSRFADTFWKQSLDWLIDGTNPWAQQTALDERV